MAFFPLDVTFPKKCYYYALLIINFQAQELVRLDVSQDKALYSLIYCLC